MTQPRVISSIATTIFTALLAAGCSGGGGGGSAPSQGVLSFENSAQNQTAQAAPTPAPAAPQAPAQAPQAPAPEPSSDPAPEPTATTSPAPAPSPTPSGGPLFTPSADTRKVFVSSSAGHDGNPGTEALPVATLAAGVALLRDGSPDWLLLKRGDVWDESFGQWRLSGASATEPMVVWTYGTGARPLIRTGANAGVYTSGGGGSPASNDYLAFSGLHFQAHTRIPGSPDYTGTDGKAGFSMVRGTKGVLVDDCLFDHYAMGLNFNDFDGIGQTGIIVRRCVVLDSYAVHPKHAQGLFANEVDELLVEDTVFDHNGWNEALTSIGAGPTIFNHNLYIQTNCTNVTIRRNVISRGSSHGIQLRPGGVCTDNVFVANPISILIGGGTVLVPGGVDATCTGNVVVEGTDMDDTNARGWGIDLNNIRSATVSGNIIANISAAAKASGNTFAIEDSATTTFANNIVWNWPGSANFDTLGPFVNDAVSAGAYNGLQGGSATLAGFIASLRAQSRASYNSAFSADSIRAYFQEGFTAAP